MDLKQLHYFVTVADEGSITAGAKKLFLSQPPLSTQIKELEKELSCILFERGARKITLTEAGKALYNYAKTILDLTRVAKEEVSSTANPDRGIVRFGMVSSLVCARPLRWVAAFSQQNPEIDFEITEGNTYQLLDQLSAGVLHFALVRTPYPKGRLESVRIASDRLVAVGHPEAFPDEFEISPEDLSKKPLIIYRRWEATLKQYFSLQGASPRIHILADDARTVIKAAELELGIAIVPQSAVEALSSQNTVARTISGEGILSATEIVYTPDGHLPGCAQKFLEFLKDKAATKN